MRFRLISSYLLLAFAACRGDLTTTLAAPAGADGKLDVTASRHDVLLLLRTPGADAGDRGGQTLSLDAVVTNPQGHVLENKKHTEWRSSNASIVTVDDGGLITAQDTGNALIIVDEKKSADTVRVRVVPVPVRSVVVAGPDSIAVRDTVVYTAAALDSVGEALVGRTVTWRSTAGSVLKSLGDGRASGELEGTAQMEAMVNEVVGRLAIRVWPPAVATVVVTPIAPVVALYRPLALTATVRDRHGVVLIDRIVSWSAMDVTILSIGANGVVTTLAPGQTDVFADVEGRRGTAGVVVTNPVEARALWVTRFEYTTGAAASATKIAEIMKKAGDARFNIVYFQVRTAGDALYNSDIEPCSPRRCGTLGGPRPAFDPLAVAITEAGKNGIQVHAWLNSMTEWIAGSSIACGQLKDGTVPRHMRYANPGWQMLTVNGAPQPCLTTSEYTWASPGVPEVRTRLAQVAGDIVRRYRVAGIHLDRIRYPGTTLSYDAPSKAAYAEGHGGVFPTSNSSPGWADLRRSFINAAVREVRDSIRAVNPGLVLSAAVWPIWRAIPTWGGTSKGYDDYFQDPRAWAAEGTLDVAAAMTYPSLASSGTYTIKPRECDYLDWTCLLMDHKAAIEGVAGRHMYIGVGAIKGRTESLNQIAKGREKQVTGFSVYSFSQVDSWAGWSILANGPFKYPATIPVMGWK